MNLLKKETYVIKELCLNNGHNFYNDNKDTDISLNNSSILQQKVMSFTGKCYRNIMLSIAEKSIKDNIDINYFKAKNALKKRYFSNNIKNTDEYKISFTTPKAPKFNPREATKKQETVH